MIPNSILLYFYLSCHYYSLSAGSLTLSHRRRIRIHVLLTFYDYVMYVIVYLFIILCVYMGMIDWRIILIYRNLLIINIFAKKKLLNVFHSFSYSLS